MRETYEEKAQRQIELERKMQTLGIDRYDAAVKRAVKKETESNTEYGSKLMAYSLKAVREYIDNLLAIADSSKPGRHHKAIKYLRMFPSNIVAFIGLRVVLDGISQQRSLMQVALRIGDMLEDELRFRTLEENEPGLHKRIMRQTKRKNERQKSIIGTYVMNKFDISFDAWPKVDKVHLGQKVIEAVIVTTGLCEVRTYQVKHRDVASRKTYLVPTAKTKEWIGAENTRNPLNTPMTLPCIIPPKPYTNPVDGGYHSPYVPHKTNLMVKTYNTRYLEEIKNLEEELETVYTGVNAMASTGWRINKPVLEVMRYFWDKDIPIADLPPRDDAPMPPCPVCGADLSIDVRTSKTHKCLENPDVRKKWKQQAAMVHEANASLWSKRFATHTTIWVAEMFQDEESIYFPVTCDFRGRAYYTPAYLNPQSTDQAKSLLLFDIGKAILTQEAADWLAVHGANCYGIDKVSFADRVAWVKENEAMILETASAPLDSTKFWANKSVDSPWQFLAFCFEWAAFKKQGFGYESSVCVSLDGSANGIQHLSACLRDPVGAQAVNMTKSVDGKPSDIYGQVAQRTNEKLQHIFETTTDEEKRKWAKKWLDFKLNRKLVKRPVMTLPYGSTLYSCREYLEEGAKELMLAGHAPLDFFDKESNELFIATCFLQHVVWEAIGEIVIAGRQVMKWLQDVAKIVAKEGVPVNWQTPTGFYVSQSYYTMKTRRIVTQIAGSRIDMSIGELTRDLDIRKQSSSVAPNFIHSMDASAMMLTLKKCLGKGLTHFGMVHDSYGTHAADTETLSKTLREAFVELYTDNNVLAQFKSHMMSIVEDADSIPEIPPYGTFDLNNVLEAEYFFA
jgi:DNA-directed RNA polymerase